MLSFSCLRPLISAMIGLCLLLPVMVQDIMAQEKERDLAAKDIAAKALADIRRDVDLSQQQMQQIGQEIEDLKKDQNILSETLINVIAKTRQLGDKVRGREQRLVSLLVQKTLLETALGSRKVEMTTNLAALERIGLRPPPALLAHPDDAVRSLRSSMLLNFLIKNHQQHMQDLQADVKRIEQIETLIMAEKMQIEVDLRQAAQEKQRLQLLLDEKKTTQQQSERQLARVSEQGSILANKAQSLQQLIEELERTKNSSPIKPEREDATQNLVVPIDDHFSRRRGQLAYPVSGIKMQSFGKNGQEVSHGELYETSSGALITTPVDGVVRYAGSFRSYGQLLILDVGQNYHLILAGMGQLYVQQGQVLLAGEPVGMMAMPEMTDRISSIGQITPMLYVEIRKDGTPIDPAPWWMRD